MQKPLIDDMGTPESDRQDNGEVPPEPGFKKTKVGWIPDEWEQVKLEEITSDLQTGPFGSKLKAVEYVQNGIPVINPSNIDGNGIRPDRSSSVTKEKREELSRYVLREGDIILARRGEIGRCAKVTSKEHGWVCGTGCLIVRPDEEKVRPDFLELAFATKRTRYWLESESVGSTMSNLSTRIVSDTPIPCPPLHEQSRIAEILSTWDRAIEQIDGLIAAEEARKMTLIQQLLRGETRFDEYVEGGFRHQAGIKGPADWDVYDLGNFVSRQRSRYNPDDLSEDVKCIELEHIAQESGRLLGYDTFGGKSSSKYAFKKGQVLFGKLRPNLKKFWQAEFSGVCSTEIWVLDADESICLNDYLFYLTQSARFHQASSITSGTRMPRASWDFLAETAFMLPPISEQRAIVELLSTCDEEIEALHTERDALQYQKKGMMQKLLKGKVRVFTDITSPQVEA